MMERMKNPVEESLSILRQAGFQDYQCELEEYKRREASLEQGNLDLLSNLEDTHLTLTGILNGSRVSKRLSRCAVDEVKGAAEEMMTMARSAPSDPANAIAPYQETPFVENGPDSADVPLMLERLKELKHHCSSRYPDLKLRRVTLHFLNGTRRYGNSNGTMFASRQGYYGSMPMFAASRGSSRSSFNYTFFCCKDLEKPLHQMAGLDELFRQTVEQMDCRKVPGAFNGDVIITQKSMEYFLYLLTAQLNDGAMVKGTSLYQDDLGKQVADERLTVSITPRNPLFAAGSAFTSDGFSSRNQTVIEKGVLESHLLSFYGSRKTGLPRAGYTGDYYEIDPGDTSLKEMVSQVKKGLLMNRFSGGIPGENGDFSGVAKNSYYIENGKILYPVREAMVRMNLKEMMKNISGVSRERLNLGGSNLPWIRFSDVPIE